MVVIYNFDYGLTKPATDKIATAFNDHIDSDEMGRIFKDEYQKHEEDNTLYDFMGSSDGCAVAICEQDTLDTYLRFVEDGNDEDYQKLENELKWYVTSINASDLWDFDYDTVGNTTDL